MSTRLSTLAVLAFLAAGCADSPTDAPPTSLAPEFAKGGFVRFVSAGGPDYCTAGSAKDCDANYSLNAREAADGTVSGEWQDSFVGGAGVHVEIDCLKVTGNGATFSGVIRNVHGDVPAGYEVGNRAVSAVVDNGTSANDPPDMVSYTYASNADCQLLDPNALATLVMQKGQVTVR